MNTYKIDSTITFKKNKDEWGIFSNMYPLKLNVNGIEVRTSEALYQALRFPHEQEIQREILEQKSPMTVKYKAAKYKKNYTHSDFEKFKVEIMEWVVRLKVAQHYYKIAPYLRKAVDKNIAELTGRDKFWGAVLNKKDKTELIGENNLGKIWMKIIADFKSDKSKVQHVEPLNISSMKILGKSLNFKYGIKTN
jgi:ribA/ribD-fused uncharacterized protein